MSTTLIVDGELDTLLQGEVQRSGEPLGEVAARLIRLGLEKTRAAGERKPFVITPLHAQLPPEWTSGKIDDLLDILDEADAR